MFNLLIFVYVIKGELILISKGDHYQEIFDINKFEALSDCNETQIHIQEHHIIEQTQILNKSDIEQILYYPSDENIILILEKVGRMTILFKDNQLLNSPFKELGEVDLNTRNLTDFTCSDMTQYSMEIFMAVCKSAQDVYISRIVCSMESGKYITGCVAELFLDTQELTCDNLSIITESTWREKDPEYFSIYCSAQESFTVSRQVLIAKMNKQSNSIQFGKLIGAIYEIEKVSFFDDNTLMILDHSSGLHVYHFLFTDDGDVTFERLLWQLFLPNEVFYALSYSHEQYGIRFPPLGIIENNIQYSIIILSDHFIYELALPHLSQEFFFTQLAINDKINIEHLINGRKLKKGQIQYDEQFYYTCLTFEIETECIRINRHQSYAVKTILSNKYPHPVMMTYPVSFSTVTGQTNILITQQISSTQARLTLIRNEIERLSLQSLTNQEFVCAIVYKAKGGEEFTLMIYNQEFESTNLFKIDHLQNYNFPNTDSTVLFSTLIRGPAPLLVPESDKNNVHVQSLSGFGYDVNQEYYDDYIQHSRIPIKTFLDKGFRAIFLQLDNVYVILQKEIPNTHYYTTEVQPLACSSSYLVKQIVGISPFYMIFYQKTNYYTLVKITDDEVFEINCQNVNFSLQGQDFEVFVDLDFINLFFSTESKIYYTDIYFKNIITIDIDRRFRQLNFQFLKNNIILGSHQNKLYQIELINPYQTVNFKTVIQEIELGNLTSNFKFFVLSIKKPIPTLVIVDERITLYTIENLQEIRFDSLLPQFNSLINPQETQINFHVLIVPTNKQNEQYIYDLSKSGSDRLHAIHKYTTQSEPVTISYPKKLTFLYCLQLLDTAAINCYFNKMLEFELITSDPSNIDNEFQVKINANSALSHSVQKTLTINGSFRYQDTMISKINRKVDQIEIYKTNYTSELQILEYYQGPIFSYELSNQNGFKIFPFIWENEDNLVRFKINQTILGTSVSKEYLIILGDETISIINIPQTQYYKQVIQSSIDYEEIKNVFFDQDQPTVSNCTKSFINTLSLAELSGIHVIALFCQSMMIRVNASNQINQLSFTILSDNQPIEQQFLDNFFFMSINYQDFLYQNSSSFILEDIKMINFPIQFKPKYKFVTVSAMVKANKRYEESQKDHLICIFYGFLDQTQSSRLKGSLLDVISASNLKKNTLIVNNFQMYCISGCQVNTVIDTIIELVFNDQYEFTLYQIKIHFYYDLKTAPRYELLDIQQLNIKELMSNFATNNIDFTYIDTEVQYHNDSKYTINVTTDSISFDLVQKQQRIEIEQIFKQYTQCQSQPGSLKASYHEFLAISCNNVSQNYSQQTQFVKLFLRGQSDQSVKSVIQAAQIQGNLMLLDIQKGYLNEKVRMLILEANSNYSEFQLRWFTLDSKFTLQADQNSTPKTTFNLQLCPSNLNQNNGLCMDIAISNTGYKHYITQEWILFAFLIATPLLISMSFIVFCIISYKSVKQRRVEQFGLTLEQQLKKQSNVQSRNEDTIY